MKVTFKINPRTKFYAVHAVNDLAEDETMVVTIQPLRKNRTLAQNRLMHQWFNEISESYHLTHGEIYAPKAWKEQLKRLFLGFDTMKLPNKDSVFLTKHTADCTTKELTEFMEKIEVYAADDLGLMLTRPEDLYFEAMGYKR